MSKKKNKKKDKETTITDYYDLKTDAIDELVDALKSDDVDKDKNISMDISEITGEQDPKHKEFNPYKVDFLSHIPVWLKAIFIKFWFAGAVCYFILWGLRLTALDGIVLSGIVLGIITDIMVNPIYKFMESDEKEYNAYMLFPFPFKVYWTFFANIVYYIGVMFAVSGCYTGLNKLIETITGNSDVIHLGVEPLLFGVFALIVDMAVIGIKDLVVYLVKRLKKNKSEDEENV